MRESKITTPFLLTGIMRRVKTMKFNLKNPLWKTNPEKAKEGFEKELRKLMTGQNAMMEKIPKKLRHSVTNYVSIKEILGEDT